MSDLTAELNLALAVDGDDTADYLTTTGGLRGSLSTIDGLFNASTGHNHNGAHQGGSITTLNLSGAITVGGLATLNSVDVTTTSHLRGAVTLDSTLSVAGATTLAGVTINGTLNPSTTLTVGLDLAVGRNETVAGTLTVSGATNMANVGMSGALSVTGSVTVGGNLNGADIYANRGNGSGYFFMVNGSHYIGFDGTNYQLPSAPLYVNSSRVVTEAYGGAVAWQAAQNLPSLSKHQGFNILGTVANANDWLVDYGGSPLVAVPNGGLANQAYSFNRAFAAPPFVIVSIGFFSGSVNTLHLVQVAAHNVTASGLQIDFGNNTGGQQSIVANWIAIGR